MPTDPYSEGFFKGPARALVIGISEYENGKDIPKDSGQLLGPKEFSNLKFAAKDAKDFANFLEDKGMMPGCVRPLINKEATVGNIKRELVALQEACDDSTTKPLVFIFFAGHGMADTRGNHYLVTYEGERDSLPGTTLSNDEFQLYLKKITTDRLVIFLDACHSGAMAVSSALGAFPTYNAPIDIGAGEGRCLIASCKPDQLSWEGDQNSIFTGHLLDLLKNGTDEITEDDINVYNLYPVLKKRVEATAREKYNKKQEPIGDLRQSTELVLAINKWRVDEKIKQSKLEDEGKRQFVELIYQWFENKSTAMRWTMVEKLRNHIAAGEGGIKAGYESFFSIFEEQFQLSGLPASTPDEAKLEEACELLASSHARAVGSGKSQATKAATATASQTPAQLADLYTGVSKPSVRATEKFVQPTSQASSPPGMEPKRQLPPEDQAYVLGEIMTKLDYLQEAAILSDCLSQPTCEADFTKAILAIRKNNNPAVTNELVGEIVKRFREKWSQAAKPQFLASVMISQKSNESIM